jgi:hypothetical protein
VAAAAATTAAASDAGGKEGLLSEEKKQKTFANSGVCAACRVRDSVGKSLLVLFFRKERLPLRPGKPGVWAGTVMPYR